MERTPEARRYATRFAALGHEVLVLTPEGRQLIDRVRINATRAAWPHRH